MQFSPEVKASLKKIVMKTKTFWRAVCCFDAELGVTREETEHQKLIEENNFSSRPAVSYITRHVI